MATWESICFINQDGETTGDGSEIGPIYSITKTLIATAILDLGLPPDEPLSTWIGSDICPHPLKLGQLLNHSSGLTDYGALPAYADAVKQGEVWDDQTFASHTLQQPLLFEPGSSFAYSNPGYWLLKKIIEIETHLDFGAAMSRHIFEPYEMPSAYVASGLFADDLPWYPAGWVWHGLVMANAEDIAGFMSRLDPVRLSTNLMPVSQAPAPWQSPHYGNGVMVEPGKWFGHNGGGPGYSASAFRFAELRVTGCVLQAVDPSADEGPDPAMATLFARLTEYGIRPD